MVIANDLQEFIRVANALNANGMNPLASDLRSSGELYRTYGYWAHRQFKRIGVINSDAVGLNDLGTDVVAVSFFADTAKRQGFVELQTTGAGDKTSVARLLPQAKRALMKPYGTGIWRAAIPLTRDESSSETIFYIFFHLGFGAVI
jgi:hypothetical protein